ncbi:MAG: hypothetical protein WEB88_13780 [Gemmatimonadota bacterium]
MADRYTRLTSRSRLFACGGLAGLVLAVLLLASAFLGRGTAIAGAPLTDSHAIFDGDCAACHTPLQGTADAKCLSCHQQSGGELGIYTFARHYMYRSGEADRSAADVHEVACGTCHREHQGREASLQEVADARCVSCHEVNSFEKDHPEFDFAVEDNAGVANLKFAHVQHVREVMAESELVEPEAACLSCHTPEADGKGFQPLAFDRHCDACHLSRSDATEPARVASGSGPGVATLGDIRSAGEPGSQWAYFWNAGEFTDLGGSVVKRPVYHADPWILHNLRKLRGDLYPGAELADLLDTSAEVPPDQVRALHREAIATLARQIEGLRGDPSPAVQREIAELSELLAAVEARLEDPYAPLDATRFGVGPADEADGVATGTMDVAAYEAVISAIIEPCVQCHVVERATIRRVQQPAHGGLARAEFDHRAHVVHARCMDCHDVIPTRELLLSGEDATAAQDRAEVVNLPTIESCRSCHGSRTAPASCTSCHQFHPDKSHWSTLSR